MEKLIELLNEYETPISGVVFKSYDPYDGTFYGVDCDGETEIAWENEYICGKKYGFIKQLIEEDKIDLDKIPIRLEKHYQYSEIVDYIVEDENILLMLLAISDTPIDDLIGYLKD